MNSRLIFSLGFVTATVLILISVIGYIIFRIPEQPVIYQAKEEVILGKFILPKGTYFRLENIDTKSYDFTLSLRIYGDKRWLDHLFEEVNYKDYKEDVGLFGNDYRVKPNK
jgi:hypothetical protein